MKVSQGFGCGPIASSSEVECSEFCSRVLESRMADGAIPAGKICQNVTTYMPSAQILEQAETLLAGFPCQASVISISVCLNSK